MKELKLKYYKQLSLFLALIFAAVGLVFLILPKGVLTFFNTIGRRLGMAQAPEVGFNFYLVLAVAYMYLVTLLAWMMARHPLNKIFHFLLANAKLASSILSFGLFIFHQPYLLYITNGIVDGLIGAIVLWFFFKIRAASQ